MPQVGTINGMIQSCSPAAAWEALKDDRNAILVDVRSAPEWQFVGVPDLSSLRKDPLMISWRVYPKMTPNEQFIPTLRQTAPHPQTPLYFICKLGGRSGEAAAACVQAGYVNVNNVMHGFDGDQNEQGQRGTVNGWRAANLPWRQN